MPAPFGWVTHSPSPHHSLLPRTIILHPLMGSAWHRKASGLVGKRHWDRMSFQVTYVRLVPYPHFTGKETKAEGA